MMLFNRLVAATLILCAAGEPQTAPTVLATVTYFLSDEPQHRWCGYSSEKEWTSRIRVSAPVMMGRLQYDHGHIYQIWIRQFNSTGDWVLDDQYELSPKGEIVKLFRAVGYLSEDALKRESYEIHDGVATRTTRSVIIMTTHEALPSPSPLDEVGSWQIFTRTKDLPFVALLERLGSSGMNKPELCVPF